MLILLFFHRQTGLILLQIYILYSDLQIIFAFFFEKTDWPIVQRSRFLKVKRSFDNDNRRRNNKNYYISGLMLHSNETVRTVNFSYMPPSSPDSINIRYLVASEQDAAWGLTIHSLGRQDIAPGTRYPPRNHPNGYYFSFDKGRILDEYQILYLTRGSGTFFSNRSGEKTIEAGSLFLLFPGEWHTYSPKKSTGWNEYWIGFRGTSMDNKVAAEFFDPCNPVLHVGVNDELIRLYQQAIEVATEQNVGYQHILSSIVEQILSWAWTLHRQSSLLNTAIGRVMGKARAIMIDGIYDNLSPDDVADQLNMSYSTFRKQFRAYTGVSPAHYIKELKIQKAKELLRSTTLTLTEIASELKYSSTEYFFTVFRRFTDMTPGAYRRQTQAERG